MTISILNFVCHALTPVRKQGDADELRKSIERKGFSWPAAIHLADRYFVSTGLWDGLKTKGLLSMLGNDVQQYLYELHQLNRKRNEHLRNQALETIRTLNDIGVKPLILKGGGQLFRPIHLALGNRIIADLDILVPKGQVDSAFKILINRGYREAKVSYGNHEIHHMVPLVKPGEYASVELHRQALHARASGVLPTAAIWRSACPFEVGGARFYLPSFTHEVLISLLHSQIGDRHYVEPHFDLRGLYDLTALADRFCAAIDWSEIAVCMNGHGLGKVLEAYFFAAHRLFCLAPPQGFTFGARARIHFLCCLATLRWARVQRLVDRYSAYRMTRRYGCSQEFIPLAVYRVRFFLHEAKSRLSNF